MPAKLTEKERLELIERVTLKGEPVSRICQEAGISRVLFYRWLKRYKKEGTVAPKKLRQAPSRQVPAEHVKKIIALVRSHPAWSTHKICKHLSVGNHGVQNVFSRLSFNTAKKRQAFVRRAKGLSDDEAFKLAKSLLSKKKTVLAADRQVVSRTPELSPQQRLEAIERVIKYGEPVAQVCIHFHISRPNFYKWLKRYQSAPEDKKFEVLQDKKPRVEHYYNQTPEKYEEAVLSVVAQYPELGVAKIVQALPQIAGKPIVGHHGVQNVLKRHDLTIYEKRLAYAQVQVTPVIRLISSLKELGIRFVTLPAKTRARVIRFASATFLSTFSTVVVLGALGYLVRITTAVPAASRIGFFFASVALLVGSLFFAYSMKYYLTLALVLSFSRQPLEEGGGYTIGLNGKSNGNHKNGNGGNWLLRIFGLGNGNGNGSNHRNGNGVVPAGGLQPSLDHVKLRRHPFFSIHLPFYNEKKVAKRILKACTSFDYPHYEVIVCDDSTDETVDIVQRYAKKHNARHPNGPKIKVLHRPTRKGFKGGALVYALKHMNPKTEFVTVFDADFIPYPDTLTQFLKYYKATGGWEEKKSFQTKGLVTMPYDTNEKVETSSKLRQMLAKQVQKIRAKSNTAVVAGYQWHVLNKSENWITRGVRTEYAGSYVIERPGQEILGALKIIHGSVYCIRADVLKHFGWGTSITEDFELTLRIYEKGFKVVFTPYIQAPSECVATLKRLIRQRMRWSEGHSYNVKKMATKLLFNPNLTLMEKLEFLYLSPYYLQAFFFIIGTFCWLISETVFPARLPFWTDLWGWSLVLTNFFALPLLNAVGLFLEESEEKDYLGLLSFIALCYILVPFQAYASVKGFIQKKEGPWFRTPKTGKITDIFTRGKFYRWISGVLPGRRAAPALATSHRASYLALATANSRFNRFHIPKRRWKGFATTMLAFLLICSVTLFQFLPFVPTSKIPPVQAEGKIGMGEEASPSAEASPSGEPESVLEVKDDRVVQKTGEITLTDNRPEDEVKDQVVQEIQPDQEPKFVLPAPQGAAKLRVEEYNPETHPEDFYLPLNQMEGAEMVKGSPLFEVSKVEPKKFSLLSLWRAILSFLKLSRVIDGEQGRTMERGFLPYLVRENEDSTVALLRSEKGLQAFVLTNDSLTTQLWETEKLKPELSDWSLKALSTPVFQYQDEENNWKDYQIDENSSEITVEEKEDFAIITQTFNIKYQVSSIKSSLKFGFDGTEYFSKWSFELGDNPNLNRLLWKVETPEEVELDSLEIDGDPPVLFYPQGIKGALEIDPILSTTVAADTVNIFVSGEFEIEMDSAKGGVIDSWYDLENDAAKTDQLANTIGGLFNFEGDDGSVRRISNSTSTTQEVLEITDARAMVKYSGDLGTADYDYVLTYTIYNKGEIYIELEVTNNTGSSITWTNQKVGIIIDDTLNHNPDTSDHWVKWAGDGTIEKDAAVLYHYSGFNYNKYYTTGPKVAFERDTDEAQANGATTTRIFKLQLRPDTDGSYSDEFLNPDSLTDGLAIGSAWEDTDEHTFADDFFNEAEGTYNLQTGGQRAKWGIDGVEYNRRQPVFKIRQWQKNTGPETVTLNGEPLSSGTDYWTEHKPFSEAWVYDSGGTWQAVTDNFNFDQATYDIFDNSGDYFYLGFHDKFSGVNLDLSTAGSGNAELAWQYSQQKDSGIATDSGTLVLEDPNKSWTVDEHVGDNLYIISGSGQGELKLITANDATTLTVASAFIQIPDTTSRYQIISWVNLSVSETDIDASHLKASGNFSLDVPVDWTRRTVNSGSRLYYIRGYNTGTPFATYPIESKITTDFLSASGSHYWTGVQPFSDISGSLLDYYYLGSHDKFSGVNLDLSTPGEGEVDITWEYSQQKDSGTATGAKTFLNGALLGGETSVSVTNASEFSNSGTAYINGTDTFTYTGLLSKETGLDLFTMADLPVIISFTAAFQTNGVASGDLFRITSGSDAGDYTIFSVDNENQITLDTNLTTSATGIEFVVAPIGFTGCSGVEVHADGSPVTEASNTVLEDTSQSWTDDEHVGDYLYIQSGQGQGEFKEIIANDATTLTVASAFTQMPDIASRYQIIHWAALSVSETDFDASHLRASGNFSFDVPDDWDKTTVNSGISLYYIRSYNTGTPYTTYPIESKITTDILLFQYLADIESDDAEFEFDPIPPGLNLQERSQTHPEEFYLENPDNPGAYDTPYIFRKINDYHYQVDMKSKDGIIRYDFDQAGIHLSEDTGAGFVELITGAWFRFQFWQAGAWNNATYDLSTLQLDKTELGDGTITLGIQANFNEAPTAYGRMEMKLGFDEKHFHKLTISQPDIWNGNLKRRAYWDVKISQAMADQIAASIDDYREGGLRPALLELASLFVGWTDFMPQTPATITPDQPDECPIISEKAKEFNSDYTTWIQLQGSWQTDEAGDPLVDLTDVENLKIYRDGSLVDTVSKTTSTWTDPSVTSGVTYDYQVNPVYISTGEATCNEIAIAAPFEHPRIALDKVNKKATIWFYEAGITGDLEIDPTLSTTVAANTVTISVSGEFEIEMDNVKGGVIDSWYDLENDSGKADQLADATDGLFDFYATDGTTRRISDSTSTTQEVLEITPTRTVVKYTGNMGAANYDYVLTYTVYAKGEIYIKLEITNNTGSSVTWTAQRAEITIDSVTNHTADGDGVASDGDAMVVGTNNWVKWVGDGTTEKDTAVLYHYSGFNYVEYYTTGTKVAFERDTNEAQGNGVARTRTFKLQLRPDTDELGTTETNPDLYSADYRTPDETRDGLSIGSKWTSPGLDFDGSDDYISFGDVIDITGALTISAWVISDVTEPGGTGHGIVTKDDSVGSRQYSLQLHTAVDGFRFGVSGDGSVYTNRDVGSAITSGVWTHVTAVYSPSTNLDIYINGILDNGALNNGPIPASIQNTGTNFRIGEFVGTSGSRWDGLIDEVRVWDTARTQAQIQADMYKQIDPNSANLVGYWRMNENTGTQAHDETTNHNDGTLTGGPLWRDGYVPDQYNETEGAYKIDANGRSAKWEIDGATNTHYKPVTKIRQWRKTDEPTTVQLDGADLASGTDYNIDHKPFSEAWYYDYNAGVGSAYTKLADGGDTGDADEYVGDTATDYTFSDNFDESGTSGDFFYLGSDDKFSGVNVLMDTLGAYAAGSPAWLTWQYYNGSAWTSLTDLKSSTSDQVQSLMANGNFYFTPPTDWGATTVNSGRSLYYIRAYNTGAAFTTSPIESKITTDILLFQYLFDISSDNSTFEFDPASKPSLTRHYLDDPYLEGFWRLEETSGTRYDETSNDNDLTDNNTVTSSTDEKEGDNSADFEELNAEYLSITDANQTGLDITGPVTVMAWVKQESEVDNYGGIAARCDSNSSAACGYWLTREGSIPRKVKFGVRDSGDSTNYEQTSTSTLTDGTWTHVAGVYDGGYVHIYWNGSEEGTPLAGPSAIYNSSDDFWVGASFVTPYYFDGLIDEVAVFSRALSATEISEIHQGGVASHSVEVDNNYKVALDKDDSDDYLVVYDKAVDNDDPPRVFEFQGAMIEEGTNNEWSLRDDDDRTTQVISATDTQIKIEVDGKYDDEDADAFLDDEGADTDLTITETYTFASDGFYVQQETDFQDDGLTLDNADADDGYRWLSVEFDGESAGEEHLETVLWGDGTTESSDNSDDAYSEAQTYSVIQGDDSYQDGFVGISDTGWLGFTAGTSSTDYGWYYDVDLSSNTDRLWTRQQSGTPKNERYSNWYFQLHPQDELDTEAEREAIANDYQNPDSLTHVTGETWHNASTGSALAYSASPSLEFDGTNDYVDVGTGPTSVQTVEFWVFPETTTEYFVNLTSTTDYIWANAGTVTATGFDTPTIYVDGVATSTIVANQWQHVAVTTATAENASNLDFGRTADANYLQGKIEEVRLWSDVRTAAEIQANMYKQISSIEAGLVGYWQLNENTGTNANDETSNNNDGTLTLGPTWTDGYVPDEYNENEAAYTTDASGTRLGFDADDVTFTAAMSKRNGPGPFAAAPIIQGDPNNADSLTDDVLSFEDGTQVSGNFYANMDTDQGAVSLWWTPEYDYNTLSGTGDHYIWYINSNYFLAYEYDNDQYNLTIGTQSITASSNIVAGTTYNLVANWDTKNVIGGSNYACLTIDDGTPTCTTTQPTASAPAANIYVGGNGTTGGGSGIIEGLTVFRRSLYDGTYGIDVGNGDEINAIYNAGSGEDPTLTTGSWDVVFALPTNSSVGALSTGTGEAWTHPHSSNLIPGNSNKGGFMLDGTYGTDGWVDEGTPTNITGTTAPEKIFAGGYQFTSDAANEGIGTTVPVTLGDDFVVRAIAHSDGTSVPKVLITGADDAEITSLTGAVGTGRTAPEVLIFTFEADATESIKVKLINTAASGTTYWHQVEVLSNLIDNPSMETGAGNPWLPTSYSTSNETDEIVQETSGMHSGSSAAKWAGTAAGTYYDSLSQSPSHTINKYYAMGVFGYAPATEVLDVGVFSVVRYATNDGRAGSVGTLYSVNDLNGSWKLLPLVVRSLDTSSQGYYWYGGDVNVIVDDVYQFLLTDVSLTVTPATETNSTESTGLRVDGRDTATQTISDLSTTLGTVRFRYTPRHDAADALDFLEATDVYIAQLYGDADDYISIYWNANNTITLLYNMAGGGDTSTTWDATSAIFAATPHAIELKYTGGGTMTLKVDGTTRITLSSIPSAFGTAPQTVYWGSRQAGDRQSDATFAPLADVSVRAEFDIDGGTYKRHQTSLKIRKYRDTRMPAAVTVEGETLFAGNKPSSSSTYGGYNAALKPFSEAWYEDGGSSTQIADGGNTNDSNEYLNEAGNDYTLTGFADTDTIYLGSDDKFNGANYILSTKGAKGGTLTGIDWEYWNGSAWADLSGDTAVIKGSDTLETTDGSFYFTEPYDWTAYKLTTTELGGTTTGERTLFWIRGTPTGGVAAYDTVPVIDRIWTDILLFQHLGELSSDNQTFIISAPVIRESLATIQIDVGNRYRMIMETGDTTDYMLFYDRYQDDSSPDATHEFQGPCILETNTYCLRDDANRITTVMESNSVRVKLRIEGKFNNEAGADYLDDEAGTPIDLTVIVDYTFTTEGVYIENMTDFQGTGVTLDADSGHNGYEWLGVWADVTDAAYDDTGSIYYGDGETESSTTTDAAEFEETNTYVMLDNASGYQDAFIGIQRAGWFDGNATGAVDEWHWDEANSGTQDLIAAQEQAGSTATSGVHYAKWFFLMLAPAELDIEVERESYINDYRNPDILEYSTAAEWSDGGASPGIDFDGVDDYIITSSIADIGGTDSLTMSVWIKANSFPGQFSDMVLFVESADSGTYDKALRIDSAGNAVFYVWDGAVQEATKTGLTTGTWYHIAGTYDGSTLRIFVNGVEGTSDTATATSDFDTPQIQMSFDGGADTAYFDGTIDEVRIWDVARTQAEIQADMYKQIDPSNEANLVGYWRMNENTGLTAYDETTNNNDGTLTNGPLWRTGFVPDHYNESEGVYSVEVSDAGLDFDGSNDYVDATDIDVNNFTISGWVNKDTTGIQTVIAECNASGPTDCQFYFRINGGSGFTTASSAYQDITVPDITLDIWHHVALTYDGSTLAFYLDGILNTSDSKSGTPMDPNLTAKIGRLGDSNVQYFNGVIDEVRIWDTARTQAQIQDNMYKRIDPASSGLVGYWRMDEDSGTTAHDLTSNANDGTLTNNPTWTDGYSFPDPASRVHFDLDGGSNVSTLTNGAVGVGSTAPIVDSTTGFDASGTAYIEGDRFTYTGTTSTTFTGVPASGEDSLIGHADNSVVSQMNRHKPMFKIRKYRLNNKPAEVTMEGTTLGEGTDYNIDYKPVSDSYFADELTWYSTGEVSAAWTSPDVGSAGTVGSATFAAGKYGNGIQVDADGEEPYFVSSSNISGTAGIVEFWFKETGTPAATGAFFAADNGTGTINMELARGGNDTDIDFTVNDGAAKVNSWNAISVDIYDGQFHHVRLTYDAATDVPDLYLDGILQTRDVTAAWAAVTPQTNTYIGDVSSVDRNIAGVIDELRIYSPASGGIDVLAEGGDTADSDEYLFSEANDYTLDFVKVDAQSRGEYLHIGGDSMFSGVNIDLATNGVGGAGLNLDWEYWDGDSWADLEAITGFTDDTSNLTADGAVYWDNIPTNWRTYSVNGSPDLYYIRASLNASSDNYTTSPIENFIKTDVLLLQYLDKVTAADQTLVVVPENLWPFMAALPAIWFFVDKKKRRKKYLATLNIPLKYDP